jgi:type II secretory pathway component PulK
MIAALWLVVAIAIVALQFALDAKERRVLGINAAERAAGRAAAAGALALTQERIETALRNAAMLNRGNVNAMRASDPLLDVDSLYSGPVQVDSVPVVVRARDLGTLININNGMNEATWRQFFSYVLKDDSKADQLAQTIMDWRDQDDLPRIKGAEHDDYVKAGMVALPANADFRDPAELLLVMGMTPEIYAQVGQYFTTHGTGIIDLNNAPVPVLWSLPGMNDALVAQILQLRSGGQRITSVAQVVGATAGRGRGARGAFTTLQSAAANQETTTLGNRANVSVTEVDLTIVARVNPQAEPVRLIATLTRAGNNTNISWRQW